MVDWHNASIYQPDKSAKEGEKESLSDNALPFHSRRSPVLCTNGCVATSQPLASSMGLSILMKGGNAADAALTIAATLAVTEPCSTGLGGDMFSLYYDAKEKDPSSKVKAINGSGRCPGALTLDLLKQTMPLVKEHAHEHAHANTRKSLSLTGTFMDDIDHDNNGNGNGNDQMNVKIQLDNHVEKDTVQVDKMQHIKSAMAVTAPGAAFGWDAFYHKHASKKFTFAELLEPAAKLAEEGFPVGPVTAKTWSTGLEADVKKWIRQEDIEKGIVQVPLSIDGRGPQPGDIMKNPDMARVLRSLGEYGAVRGFYQAFPGRKIVEAVQKHGGVMTMDDLDERWTKPTFPETISVEYRGIRVHQIPPNGQGVAGLIALSGLNALEQSEAIPPIKAHPNGTGWESSQTLHAMIEMMRLGFGDARKMVCDTEFFQNQKEHDDEERKEDLNVETDIKSNEYLLDETRISERAKKVFDPNDAVVQGIPDPTSCTVSFQVVDGEGNAVSFVNSNFMGFGTGIVPDGCGFTLQNRGAGFSFEEGHPNVIEPRKRPYHTIIPAMLTHSDTNELYATISNMGGFMQPQGHMQLTVALACGLDPQSAIDQPRFCIADGTHDGVALVEEGVEETIIHDLEVRGHKIVSDVKGPSRSLFGKAQIIKRDRKSKVLWAGSDGRSDGCAMGF